MAADLPAVAWEAVARDAPELTIHKCTCTYVHTMAGGQVGEEKKTDLAPRHRAKATCRRGSKRPTIVLALSVLVAVPATLFCPPRPASPHPPASLPAINNLQIPALLRPSIEDGVKVFRLTVQPGESEFLKGKPTKTMGYNGAYLGPTIRASKGEEIRVEVTNALPDATTVHWHGMHLPAAMDGGAHKLIGAGEIWWPRWTITNQAATLSYHSHLMGKTGEQVYPGLSGLFILDDDNSASLRLPDEYGVDDIPLIVQDRRFDTEGQFVYKPAHSSFRELPGVLGDTILVNGTFAPYADVPAKLIRLRIVNGSNARRYNFGFRDRRAFYQIATDDGLLEGPVARTHRLLAPVERGEIVVDLSRDTMPLTLMSDAVGAEDPDENRALPIVELRQRPTAATPYPLPGTRNSIALLKVSDTAITRRLVLDWGSKSINGKSMESSRVDLVANSGEVEIGEIVNESDLYHPFHIHGVQFQILDRNGTPPLPYERGWKDMVLVASGETVRVITRMLDYGDPELPYMFHSHILEHEGTGVIGQFVVVEQGTPPGQIRIRSGLTEAGAEEPSAPRGPHNE